MSKPVALIIKQVGNRWQARLPGNILVKEFRYKWDALKFHMTDEEKQALLLARDIVADSVKAMNPDITEAEVVAVLATVTPDTPTEIAAPEGLIEKSAEAVAAAKQIQLKRKHKGNK